MNIQNNYSEILGIFNNDIYNIQKDIESLCLSKYESSSDLLKKIGELKFSISNWQKSENVNLLEDYNIKHIQEINRQLISIVNDLLTEKKDTTVEKKKQLTRKNPILKELVNLFKISNVFNEHIQSFIPETSRQSFSALKAEEEGKNSSQERIYMQSPSTDHHDPIVKTEDEEEQKIYEQSSSLDLSEKEEDLSPQQKLDPEFYSKTPTITDEKAIQQTSSSKDVKGRSVSDYAPSNAQNDPANIKFPIPPPSWTQHLMDTIETEDRPITWPPLEIDLRSSVVAKNPLSRSIELTESTFSLAVKGGTVKGGGKDKNAVGVKDAGQLNPQAANRIRDAFKDQSPESKGLVIQDNLQEVLRAYLPLSTVIAKKIDKISKGGTTEDVKLRQAYEVLKKYGFSPLNPKIKNKDIQNKNQESLRVALEAIYKTGSDKEKKIIRTYISWYIGEHLIGKFPIFLVFDKAVKAGLVKEQVIQQESEMVDALTDRIADAKMYLDNWQKFAKMSKLSKEEKIHIKNALKEISAWQTYVVRNKMVTDKKEKKPTGAMSPLYALGSLDNVDSKLLNGYELRDGFKDLAEAVWVAHQFGVLHNDISTRNVLVTLVLKKTNNPKEKKEGEVAFKFGLGDWGLAQFADKSKKGSIGQEALRPLKWIAPESFILKPSGSYELSDKTDVWAFGITLVEQVSGNLSDFLDYSPRRAAEFMQRLTQDIQTNGGDNVSGPNTFMMECLERFQADKNQKVKFTPEAVELLKKIFENNPEKRLNFHQIVRFLEEMKKNAAPLCSYDY